MRGPRVPRAHVGGDLEAREGGQDLPRDPPRHDRRGPGDAGPGQARSSPSKGVKVAGGITITINEANQFETYCYSNPEHRKKLQRGRRVHREELRRVHPRRLLLHQLQVRPLHQGEGHPQLDGVPAGADGRGRAQPGDGAGARGEPEGEGHDQVPELVRPLPEPRVQPRDRSRSTSTGSTRAPRRATPSTATSTCSRTSATRSSATSRTSSPAATAAAGSTPGGLRNLDRYAEQLWLTLFAKAPEITLFDIRQLYQPIAQADGSVVPESQLRARGRLRVRAGRQHSRAGSASPSA